MEGLELGTPTMHRAKIAHLRVRMEGWRQRRPGSNVRNPQVEKKQRKISLTHTGLLMEGVTLYSSGENANFASATDLESAAPARHKEIDSANKSRHLLMSRYLAGR
jgi:hypothetical protein